MFINYNKITYLLHYSSVKYEISSKFEFLTSIIHTEKMCINNFYIEFWVIGCQVHTKHVNSLRKNENE